MKKLFLSQFLFLSYVLCPPTSVLAAPEKVVADTKTHAVTTDSGASVLDFKNITLTIGGMTVSDASGVKTIGLGSTSGTKLGAIGEKLGFLGATPVVRPTSTTDLRQALINLGLYTTGGASPLSLNGGSFSGGTGTFTGTVSSTAQITNLDYIDVSRAPYNADMTGATNSTTALNNAITAAQAAKKSVYIPTGILSISSTINITAAVGIQGPGTIRWDGSVGGQMMKLYHFSQQESLPFQVTLDANNIAASGIEFDGVTYGSYRNIKVANFTTGFGLKDHGTGGNTSSYKTFHNTELLYQQGSLSTTGAALVFDGTHAGGNSCHNTFINTKITITGSKDGIELGPMDNNVLIDTFIYQPDNPTPPAAALHTGAGVRVAVDPVNAAGLPQANLFFHLQASNGGWVQANCPNPATIYGYAKDNGQPDPVLNGTQLTVLNNSGDFSGLQTVSTYGSIFSGSEVRARGNIYTQNSSSADRLSSGVFASDYSSSFRATYLTQGDSATTGTIAGGPWANTGGLFFDNTSRGLIRISNGNPIELAHGDTVDVTIAAGAATVAGALNVTGLTTLTGALRTNGGIIPATSTGTALFAEDASAASTFTIANGATGHPFGNTANFSGKFTIVDPSVSGAVAEFLVGGGQITMLGQAGVGANFTTTTGTATHTNVYLNGTTGAVEIQNNTGSSVGYRVRASRMRDSL